jgi:magnesium transporter
MNAFINTTAVEGEVLPLQNIKVQIMNYNAHGFKETEAQSLSECLLNKTHQDTAWINVEGLEDRKIIQQIGTHYGFHELLMEDVLHTEIRPKIDFFDHHLLVVLKMLKYNEQKKEMEAEQVSLVMGENYVISFQEEAHSDVFGGIRQKIRNGNNKLTHSGADFLLYSLIDSIVDNYFVILEHIGDDVEEMEQEIIENASPGVVKHLYSLKRELIFTRRSVWPLREILSTLEREENSQIRKETRKYIRDIYDHTIQVIDAVESMRDVMTSLLDVYLSSISNRMNTVMKTLTILSTIFMPLTFVAGVYGMNFENMPELHWKYGYFEVLGVMFVISLCMIFYFRRKKWL